MMQTHKFSKRNNSQYKNIKYMRGEKVEAWNANMWVLPQLAE